MCVWKNVQFPVITRFPSWPYYVSHLVCFVFNIIQIACTLILNYLAIHAFYKSSQLRRKTTLFIVMVLSVNDFAIGLIVQPLFLCRLGSEIFGNGSCFTLILCMSFLDILLGFSMMTLLVLNFEIYLSIIHPIYHKTKITNRRIFYALGFLWFLLSIRSYLFQYHLNKKTKNILVVVLVLFMIFAMVYMHSRILITALNRRRIHPEASNNCRGNKLLRGVKEAKSCLLVVFFTTCCYLPSAISKGLSSASAFKVIIFYTWSTTFFLTASVLNSIVFYWRNKILRREATNVIQKLFRRLKSYM